MSISRSNSIDTRNTQTENVHTAEQRATGLHPTNNAIVVLRERGGSEEGPMNFMAQSTEAKAFESALIDLMQRGSHAPLSAYSVSVPERQVPCAPRKTESESDSASDTDYFSCEDEPPVSPLPSSALPPGGARQHEGTSAVGQSDIFPHVTIMGTVRNSQTGEEVHFQYDPGPQPGEKYVGLQSRQSGVRVTEVPARVSPPPAAPAAPPAPSDISGRQSSIPKLFSYGASMFAGIGGFFSSVGEPPVNHQSIKNDIEGELEKENRATSRNMNPKLKESITEKATELAEGYLKDIPHPSRAQYNEIVRSALQSEEAVDLIDPAAEREPGVIESRLKNQVSQLDLSGEVKEQIVEMAAAIVRDALGDYASKGGVITTSRYEQIIRDSVKTVLELF